MSPKFQKLIIVTGAMGASQFFLSYFALSMGQVFLAQALAYGAFFLPPAFFLAGSLVLAFLLSNHRVNANNGNAPKGK